MWEGGGLDPMEQRFLVVTNGQQGFVVRAFRRRMDEPLRFELTQGRLTAKRVTIEIQEAAIRKEMQNHFSWSMHPPSDATIESFIVLFKQLVDCLSAEEFRISRYDCADASVGYSGLNAAIVEGLLKECARHFAPDAVADLERFVESQKHSDGVMAIRIRHQYGIENSVELAVNHRSK
jgi:hypothetical protein